MPPSLSLSHFASVLLLQAPELFNGTRVDEKCDVYSLGCIMYECVTRRVPFEELSRGAQASMGLFQVGWGGGAQASMGLFQVGRGAGAF